LLKNINIKNNVLLIFIFFSILFIGIKSFNSYGISLDEKFHRDNGLSQYNYVKSFFNPEFDENYSQKIQDNINEEKHFDFAPSIQPSFFDLVSEILIDLFKIETFEKIFKFKHFLNYLIYSISIIFFYRILFKRYKSKILSLIGASSLFLYPRIFANSFYNQKDIFFSSVFIIFIYFFFKYLLKPKNKYVILLSLFFSILFTSRIFSLIILGFFLVLSYCYFIRSYKNIIFDCLKFIFLSVFLFLFLAFSMVVSNK